MNNLKRFIGDIQLAQQLERALKRVKKLENSALDEALYKLHCQVEADKCALFDREELLQHLYQRLQRLAERQNLRI